MARSTSQTATPLSVLAMMWISETVDFVLPGNPLDYFGIRPRQAFGLLGIFCAPFLHGGFLHLIANTVPLLVLGLLVAARRVLDFGAVFVISMVVGGLGTWLFGLPNSIHIGASGIVFGLFGFLLFRAVFERSLAAFFFALVAVVLYGGMFWALFPVKTGISWSGHFFGFIGGVVAARSLSKRS